VKCGHVSRGVASRMRSMFRGRSERAIPEERPLSISMTTRKETCHPCEPDLCHPCRRTKVLPMYPLAQEHMIG
jgi:hypothetical protein